VPLPHPRLVVDGLTLAGGEIRAVVLASVGTAGFVRAPCETAGDV
jgi:hypothetical protein